MADTWNCDFRRCRTAAATASRAAWSFILRPQSDNLRYLVETHLVALNVVGLAALDGSYLLADLVIQRFDPALPQLPERHRQAVGCSRNC